MKWKKDYHDEKRGRTKAPFSGLVDRNGLPEDLSSAETSALRSLSPRRNRWPEVARFDERVAELQQRQTKITEELTELRERLRLAPAADRDALADWLATGEKGARPEASTLKIEEEIATLEADFDGFTRATEAVLAEKATHVERHRVKLVREADRSTEAAHRRVVDLIDQLAAAREQLADHRESAIWASVYPDAAAGSALPRQLLAGGLQRPVAEALGIPGQVRAEGVFQALRADADFIKTAATRQQREVINGPASPTPHDEAIWTDTPEGAALDRERDRAEKKKALARLADPHGRG